MRLRVRAAAAVVWLLALSGCAGTSSASLSSSASVAPTEVVAESSSSASALNRAAPHPSPSAACGKSGAAFIASLVRDSQAEAFVTFTVDEPTGAVEASGGGITVSSIPVKDVHLLAGALPNGDLTSLEVELVPGARMFAAGTYAALLIPAPSQTRGQYGVGAGMIGTFVVQGDSVQEVCAVDMTGTPTQTNTGGADTLEALTTMVASDMRNAARVADVAGPNTPLSEHVIQGFDLYTHCGIRGAKIGSDYYAASPVLDDGDGNPPTGWGNPGQVGEMTVYGNGTAHFFGPGGLNADFRIRPGATTWWFTCS